MMLTDYMWQEKREEEDFPGLKIALTHPYKGYKEKHGAILITAPRNNTDDRRAEITRKQKWKENNSMDLLTD